MFDPAKLNTATKYPSIETYHPMDGRGKLQDTEPMSFPDGEQAILTEKVDGAGARIIRLPGNDYWVASRDELLYAKGDRWGDQSERIVEQLRPVADLIGPTDDDTYIHVYYIEVYGGRIGSQSKQYSGHEKLGHQLFDIAFVPVDAVEDPAATLESLSTWRKAGGLRFATESTLQRFAEAEKIPLAPRLGTIDSGALPTALEDTETWLRSALPCTNVALDDDGGAKAEGIVLRTATRSVIAKARFGDYAKALAPQPQKKRS